MIYFVDLSFVILLLLLVVFGIMGGLYSIVDYLNRHLPSIIVICLVVMVLVFVLAYRMGGKRWKTSWFSLIYSSQTCFFVVYGMYELGLLYVSHPLGCVLLLIVYALYVMFNSLGLLLFVTNIGYDEDEYGNKDDGYVFRRLKLKTGDFGYIVLGILGWLINMFVFL